MKSQTETTINTWVTNFIATGFTNKLLVYKNNVHGPLQALNVSKKNILKCKPEWLSLWARHGPHLNPTVLLLFAFYFYSVLGQSARWKDNLQSFLRLDGVLCHDYINVFDAPAWLKFSWSHQLTVFQGVDQLSILAGEDGAGQVEHYTHCWQQHEESDLWQRGRKRMMSKWCGPLTVVQLTNFEHCVWEQL